ncbi:hypothetical protein BH09ACT2_BH09ACT2_09930 [soil metagenome]
MTNKLYDLRSGRHIGVSLSGDPFSERIVAFFHPEGASGPFDPGPRTTRDSEVQIVAVDRPGYGASDPLPEGVRPTVESFADDLAEYARNRGLVHPTHADRPRASMSAVGWGFGGAIALSLAARHPELVRNVVTVGLREPARLAEHLDLPLPAAAAEEIAAPDRDWASSGLENRLHRLKDASALGQAYDRRAAVDVSWASTLSNVVAHTTLIYGDLDDTATREDGSWYRHRIPGSRIAIVRDAGTAAIARVWRQILARLES